MDEKQKAKMIEVAQSARLNAYAPYSVYHVGAAVLSEDGEIFAGCNVENSSYGLTVCAERNAIARMVCEGRTKLVAVAVATREGRGPCGMCLQALWEFAQDRDKTLVVCVGESGERDEWRLSELMPRGFSAVELRKERTDDD